MIPDCIGRKNRPSREALGRQPARARSSCDPIGQAIRTSLEAGIVSEGKAVRYMTSATCRMWQELQDPAATTIEDPPKG